MCVHLKATVSISVGAAALAGCICCPRGIRVYMRVCVCSYTFVYALSFMMWQIGSLSCHSLQDAEMAASLVSSVPACMSVFSASQLP